MIEVKYWWQPLTGFCGRPMKKNAFLKFTTTSNSRMFRFWSPIILIFFFLEDTVTNPVIWLVLYAVRICGKKWSSRSTKSSDSWVIARQWKYIGSEVANLTKILSGRKGNKASETATSVKCLTVSKPPRCLITQETLEMQERQHKGDNPSGGVLFYKSKFLVSCTWTGDRTEHTEDEGLGECIQAWSARPRIKGYQTCYSLHLSLE